MCITIDPKRVVRAQQQRDDYRVSPNSTPGEWTILHRSGRFYTVTEAGSCSCPDHTGRGVTCKHYHRLLSHLGECAAAGTAYCRECGTAYRLDLDSAGCPDCLAREQEERAERMIEQAAEDRLARLRAERDRIWGVAG